MHTVHSIPYIGYFVRSPGGRVVDKFSVNMTIPDSQERAEKEAQKLADRLNGKKD